jgi:WD40 repeat protein
MRILFLIILFLSISTASFAQSVDCPDCPCVLRQAEKMVAKKHYDQAIKLFNAYKVCAPVSESAAIDQRIVKVFELIERQRDEANAARQEANEQREQAERMARANNNALKAIQIEKTNPTLALRMAEANYKLFPESATAAGIFSEIMSKPDEGRYIAEMEQGWYKFGTDLVASPNGQHLIVGSRDGMLRVWDINKEELIKELSTNTNEVVSVAISPSGKYCLTGTSEGKAQLWDTDEWRIIDTLITNAYLTKSVAFSPICEDDENCLLLLSNGGKASLWDIEGNLIHEFGSRVSKAIFTPDGQNVITKSNNDIISIWNLECELIHSFEATESVLIDMIIIPECPLEDGCTFTAPAILTTASDGTAKLWDLEGKLIYNLDGHDSYVVTATYHQGRIITADRDGIAQEWNLEGKLMRTFHGHLDEIMAITPIPNQSTVATASRDRTIKLWGLKHQALFSRKKSMLSSGRCSFTPNGQLVAVSSNDNGVELINFEGQKLLSDKNKEVSQFTFSLTGDRLAFNEINGNFFAYKKTITVCDRYGSPILDFDAPSDVYNIEYLPQGDRLIGLSKDGNPTILNSKGALIAELGGHKNYIVSMDIAKYAEQIMTIITGKNKIMLWDLDGKLVHLINVNLDDRVVITAGGISDDGRQILIGDINGRVYLTNDKGEILMVYKAHTKQINDIVFYPDQKYFIVTSLDGKASIWNLNGNIVQMLEGHRGSISSVDISSDGNYIITTGRDDTHKLWLNTEKYLKTMVKSYTYPELADNGLEYTSDDYKKMINNEANDVADQIKYYKRIKTKYKGATDNLHYVNALILLDQLSVKSGEKSQTDDFQNLETHQELTTAAYYFSRQEKWEKAEQLLEKAIQQGAGTEAMIELHKVRLAQQRSFDIQLMLNVKHTRALQMGINYFKAIKDWKNAKLLSEHLLTLEDTPDNRFQIHQFCKKVGSDCFEELFFMDDINALNEYLIFFRMKSIIYSPGDRDSNMEQLLHRLGLHAISLSTQGDDLTEYANYTNNYAWQQLQGGDFKGAEITLREGLSYASGYEYFHSNLPLALLLQGKYEEAENLYLEYKDQPWLPNTDHKTFKGVFLADINEFEEKKIIPAEHLEAVERIKALLQSEE